METLYQSTVRKAINKDVSNWPDPQKYIRGSAGGGVTGSPYELVSAYGDPLAEGCRHPARQGLLQVVISWRAMNPIPAPLARALANCDFAMDEFDVMNLPFIPGGKQCPCNAITAWVCEQCLPNGWAEGTSDAMLGCLQDGEFENEPGFIIGGIGAFRHVDPCLRKFSGPILSCSFMEKLHPVRACHGRHLPHGWGYEIAPLGPIIV